MKTNLCRLAALSLLMLAPAPALGADDDLPMGHSDRVAQRLEADRNTFKRAPLEVAAQVGVRADAAGLRDFSALLFAILPLDRLAGSRLRTVAPRALAEGPAASPEVQTPAPVVHAVLTAVEVRALVDAAVKHAGLQREEKRLDDLSSRARAAAALPELRIRVARITDESQSLSPTEYDPLRITADARSTLWLEARATWRLDRLVFADEEVSIERQRRDVGADRLRLTERVTALVGAWQKASVDERRDDTTDVERLQAAVRALDCETALDVISGGWLTEKKLTERKKKPAASE